MKKQNFAGLFIGLCVCAAPLIGQAQVNTVYIMPEGDSVTARGSNPESSYRYWLYTKLQDAGFNNFHFVGNQTGVSDGTPANSWPEESYEGGGPANDAWGTQDGIDNIGDANSRHPDIVLLDLGANDYDPAVGVNSSRHLVRTNLETIINGLAAAKPGIIILLAKPTPWVTSSQAERRFMTGLGSTISAVARDERKAGVNVITVDLFGGFNARQDTVDGTHPNIRGEQKIANKYFTVLNRILKNM